MALRDVKNKVAVVTGAAQGIGLAIVKAFLEKGAKTVIILDIQEDNEVTKELNTKYGPNKAIYIKCDVTQDLETVSKYIYETVDVVDLLVNNAGIMDETSIRKTMEINAIAVMEWTLKFFEHMKRNNYGTIINIASRCILHHTEYLAVYKASKYAIMGFSRTFGHPKNFDRYGVRVMVVCPGATVTDIGKNREKTVKMFDDHYIDDYVSNWKESKSRQMPDCVGKAVVEVFERGESGTAWLKENGKAVIEIPYLI